MPLDPQIYLSAIRDSFTPVRDTQARLLGCIPKLPDNADLVTDHLGNVFDVRWSMQPCVCVDLNTQTPTTIEGFIPLNDTDIDLAVPVAVPDDTDIGEEV